MLEIALVGGATSAIYKLAKDNGLKGWIWALLSILGYFGGAFVAGIILFIVSPNSLDDRLVLGLVGIGAGGVGILIIYLLLRMQINKANNEISDSNLLDDEI